MVSNSFFVEGRIESSACSAADVASPPAADLPETKMRMRSAIAQCGRPA